MFFVIRKYLPIFIISISPTVVDFVYSVKIDMRQFIWILFGIGFPLLGMAQGSTSLQRFTVTSVTLIMDSVDTVEEIQLVKQAITAHKEVQDFDVKMKNCNFTMTESPGKLDQIIRELAAYNQPAKIYAARAGEIFTRVAEESCDSRKKQVPNMSEEEVIKRGITKQGGQ